MDRIANIGEQPKLSSIDNPTARPGYKPLQLPMPTPELNANDRNSL
jgi:flagellar L-ring protein FlgH